MSSGMTSAETGKSNPPKTNLQEIKEYLENEKINFGKKFSIYFKTNEKSIVNVIFPGPAKRIQPFILIPIYVMLSLFLVRIYIAPLLSSDMTLIIIVTILLSIFIGLVGYLVLAGIFAMIEYIINGDLSNTCAPLDIVHNFLKNIFLFPFSYIASILKTNSKRKLFRKRFEEIKKKQDQIYNLYNNTLGNDAEHIFEGITLNMVKDIVNKDYPVVYN